MKTCRLAYNENPLGPSPKALQAAAQALDRLHHYPDPNDQSLAAELARRHGVDVEDIILGNGSAELITLLIRAFCTARSQDQVLAVAPSFPVYRHEAETHRVRYTAVPLDPDAHFDVHRLAAATTPHTRVCFLCNPNNPTGSYLSRRQLERLAHSLPDSTLLVVDEAYFEYVTANDFCPSIPLRPLHQRVATLRTFSKAYGLAGLRVGYMVLPPDLAHQVRRISQPYRVNALAQCAALAALEDADHLARTTTVLAQGMAYLRRACDRLGIRYWPSQANFLLIDPHGLAVPVHKALLGQDIHVSLVPEVRCLRVTVGLPEQNRRLVRAFETLLAPRLHPHHSQPDIRDHHAWPATTARSKKTIDAGS